MFTKLVRIGRTAELRYTPNGKAVIGLACAYDVGYGDKKRTQWIECALWEKRAESLAEYLVKGQQAVVTLTDVEIEEWRTAEKSGAKLKARIVDIELCGSKPEAAPKPQPKPQAPAAFDDFDDDIPFN